MKTETTLYDKSGWAEGEWQQEPDKIVWIDEPTGLFCEITRVEYSGHLCGYVGVPKSHPFYKEHYNDLDVDVHGGLTYSDFSDKDNLWWIGFDCAHPGDISFVKDVEVYERWKGLFEGAVYRNVDYVINQCKLLALQINKASRKPLLRRLKEFFSRLFK